jgi:beta-fructofuranosidase
MNPGKPTGEWNQIMSLPRRLTLIGKDEIGQEPAGDIESLRYDHQSVGPMTLPANKEIVLKNIKGNAMEIMAEIDVKDAPSFEVNVLRSPKKEEFTRIVFFRNRGFDAVRQGTSKEPGLHNSIITLETSNSSLHPDVRPRAPETASVLLDKDEPLKLRIFVDKSIVEVFVNGKQVLAARVYPSKDNSVGVSLRSQGKDSQLKSLDAWQMRSIY